ncbi:unnamed protein product [Didymodactylos carnosus]|uniref:Uncharacterized protein n=1 Tax=Didymodactylos carnosus TaxID=1234261 RepID=A0A814UI09_9BILA|nr:unnamed protein product [Didymodactylos carnosus]CAF1174951.1 unnamed protein product [Didymodactylos carnosus]CAF3656260.1 unnamed protein product [Didymodactylos carnosus]CAF3938877.1 unnamed protein product [Didymodactylos carnosus]
MKSSENPLHLIQTSYNTNVTTDQPQSEYRRNTQIQQDIVEHFSQGDNHSNSGTGKGKRKSSVHDVTEVSKEEFNKIIIDLHENFSRLREHLENLDQSTIQDKQYLDEFLKSKRQLIMNIKHIIDKKLIQEITTTSQRSSVVQKQALHTLYAHHIIYLIEHLCTELFKTHYLLNSFTLSSSSNLSDIAIKQKSISFSENAIEFKKDIADLEGYAYMLGQKFYCQIPDINNSNGNEIATIQLKSTKSKNQKSLQSQFCARLYAKCHFVCCICSPTYI